MLLGGNGRIRNKPEPVIISHIKVKLATCTEMKNADGIRQWLIALGKTLANYGLKKELYQLCQDLLGPTHSSAMVTSNWSPTVAVRKSITSGFFVILFDKRVVTNGRRNC